MKIVQINTVPNGSTGSIMMNIHNELLKQGHESYVVWGRGRKSRNDNEIYMNDRLGVYFHVLYARLTGKIGFASRRATKKLIKRLDMINPDIVHLHNIHGYYINIRLLFNYLKEKNIKVVWTYHDCWPFTGHCSYFDMCECNKWKLGCKNCPQTNIYPKSLKDSSEYNYKIKKELFTNVNNLTIVTPSIWLSNLVKQSFLKDYDVVVINNGINKNIFKKIDSKKLKFRKNYNLEDKKIILGVAAPWTERKGLTDFLELSKIISDDYVIVLVGLNKKQLSNLPDNIIGLERTDNVEELVDIYNSSNVFFNPTYEDNYPTTNLEAQSSGLITVTYDTGGSPESVPMDNVISKNNRDLNCILEKLDKSSKVNQKIMSEIEFSTRYLELYKNIIKKDDGDE